VSARPRLVLVEEGEDRPAVSHRGVMVKPETKIGRTWDVYLRERKIGSIRYGHIPHRADNALGWTYKHVNAVAWMESPMRRIEAMEYLIRYDHRQRQA